MPALKSTQKKKGAGGRPPSYKADYATQAAKLCELGATDEEVAAFFLVSVRTVYRWKLDYPEFCQALKNGKDVCDDRVERSLYQNDLPPFSGPMIRRICSSSVCHYSAA